MMACFDIRISLNWWIVHPFMRKDLRRVRQPPQSTRRGTSFRATSSGGVGINKRMVVGGHQFQRPPLDRALVAPQYRPQ
ncbi:hypothetical protein SLA2020_275560 [Shorea laevis]